MRNIMRNIMGSIMRSMNYIKNLSKKELMKNLFLYFIGVGIMPLGVVLTINAHLGSGGYDALNFALADLLQINTSFAIYGTAFFFLIISALVRRGYPRITTFISSFFLGIFTDIWRKLLYEVQGDSIISSILLLVTGLIVIAFAVACYMISVFPTNPTDDLIAALNEKGIKIGIAKVGFDGLCVVLALLMNGEIGAGTIICTFGLGPVIDIFHKYILKITDGNNMKGKPLVP